MGSGYNKVILIGNLGDEPQMRTAQATGNPVATFSLAVTEKHYDQNGQLVENTEWVRCVAFGRIADTVGRYLHKGSQVQVEGKLRTSSYEKDGVKRYSTEVVLNPTGLLMLGRPQGAGDNYRYEDQPEDRGWKNRPGYNPGGYGARAPAGPGAPQPAGAAPARPGGRGGYGAQAPGWGAGAPENAPGSEPGAPQGYAGSAPRNVYGGSAGRAFTDKVLDSRAPQAENPDLSAPSSGEPEDELPF